MTYYSVSTTPLQNNTPLLEKNLCACILAWECFSDVQKFILKWNFTALTTIRS